MDQLTITFRQQKPQLKKQLRITAIIQMFHMFVGMVKVTYRMNSSLQRQLNSLHQIMNMKVMYIHHYIQVVVICLMNLMPQLQLNNLQATLNTLVLETQEIKNQQVTMLRITQLQIH